LYAFNWYEKDFVKLSDYLPDSHTNYWRIEYFNF
jgi:hypothetical protein